ncbi:unnamed protein product [Blepharisma stoltei]|uniref:Mitochondrial import inner membrane translocase subunit TIM50 n=1 Tax=Blepharisma stoltei TaxID=1481888 RepID=A0AAU9JHI1_9CILI|nr:unnamed protein product [Blepharisma stoltei]
MIKLLKRAFSILGPQSAKDQGKLTVVLDLDETLGYVYHPEDVCGYQYQPDIKEDAVIDLKTHKTQLFIYKRPHLQEFLELLDEHFEPILWSTGEKEYTDLVADVIDPKGIFRQRLYQDDCTYQRVWNYPQYEFLKDIRALRNDVSRTVIIDDDWQGMYFQPDNYLNIDKFEAYYQDDWLKNDIPRFLMEMKDLPDIRPYLRARFMMKYAWAKEGQLYELTDEDVQWAKYMGKYNHTHYKELKSKYDQLFEPGHKLLPSNKLW